jgi:ParB family chromosome partitioning protein
MSAAKKGLGRSFESLIPTDLLDESFDPSAQDDQKVSDLRTIKLSEITPDPDQPRRHFDEAALDELSASIAAHGVLQPIVVIPAGGNYQIVAGERRYRASLKAGKTSIPALVRTLSSQHKLEISLIENIQRRDLNPLETATAYAKLRDQFNLTLEEIGGRVGGKSVSAVSNTLRLLKLPKNVKQAVADGELSEGQARPLVGADEKLADSLLKRIIDEGWSARKVEQYVTATKTPTNSSHKPKLLAPRPVANLTKKLGMKVTAQESASGSGKLIIEYKTADERRRLEDELSK